jgi:hypothetical protein
MDRNFDNMVAPNAGAFDKNFGFDSKAFFAEIQTEHQIPS